MPLSPPNTPDPTVAPSTTINVSSPYTLAAGQEVFVQKTIAFVLNPNGGQGGSILNSGEIIVHADPNLAGAAIVDQATFGTAAGDSVTNSATGSIYVLETGNPSFSGQISGIESEVNVSNAGLIQVVATGSGEGSVGVSATNYYGSSTTIKNTNTLTVWSSSGVAGGIYASYAQDLENSGNITVVGGAKAYGIEAYNIAGGLGAGKIVNSGVISVTATGVDLTQFPSGGGSYGIQVSGSSGTVPGQIINSGTITADTAIIYVNEYSPTQNIPLSINNTGVINGAIELAQANADILNKNMINGAIHMGSGTSTLDSRGGTITGVITVDPGTSGGVINDTIYAPDNGGVVHLVAGDASVTLNLTGSSTAATTLQFDLASSQATFTPNADGSLTIATINSGVAVTRQVQTLQFSDVTISANVIQPIFHEYETLLGRDPTSAEVGSAAVAVTRPSQISLLGATLLAGSAAQTYTQAQITSLYDTYFGRDPTSGEVAVWQGLFSGGSDEATLRAALLADPTGQTHTNATVTSLYELYFGRDPTSAELANWDTLILNGADFHTLKTALAADPAGSLGVQIIGLYDTYFGRDPSVAEVNVWRGLIAGGATTATLRNALVNDPVGQAHTTAEVTALYDTYFGRDPLAAELTVWQGLIHSGADFNTLRSALIADPVGQAHVASEVTSLYQTYFGRAPMASEVTTWQGLIAGGADFGTLRSALVNDPVGQAHTNVEITSLYDTYFGRDPSAAELHVWQDSVTHGADFGSVRTTLLADPAGQIHTDATVTSLYDTYFGRDPSAGELGVWHGLIAGGDDFNTVRSALLADPAGRAHTDATVTSLYDAIFARNPTSGETGVWEGLVTGGAGFDQVKDALLRDSGSSAGGVHHVAVTGGQTLTFDPSWTGAAVSGFNTIANNISLSSAEFGAINPLDAAHAHQITALDGSMDVLISLDATHNLLIEHTTLASLQPSDFLFS